MQIMTPIFQNIFGYMVNVRTESPIYTNFSVQSGDISNFDESEKIYLDVFIYINGSKVYPGESSTYFIQRM